MIQLARVLDKEEIQVRPDANLIRLVAGNPYRTRESWNFGSLPCASLLGIKGERSKDLVGYLPDVLELPLGTDEP